MLTFAGGSSPSHGIPHPAHPRRTDMPSYYALITILAGPPGQRPPYPDQGLPPGQGGYPSHPIYNPVYPDQGLPGHQPYPDQGLPGHQPYPDQGLPGWQPRPDQGLPPGQGGRPTHPIYQPPGIWGGGNVPMPNPPIYFPPPGGQPPLGIWGPTDPRPGYGLPGSQPRPDQGLPGQQPKPTHPIVIPPGLPAELPDLGPVEWK